MTKCRWFLLLLALALPVRAAAQQPATITGRVLSESGAPLTTVSV